MYLFTLTIFMASTSAFACGNEKDVVEKENCHTSEKTKSCCEIPSSDNDCDGSCGSKSCAGFSSAPSSFVLQQNDFTTKPLFASMEKSPFYFGESHILTGFVFIWDIPNIG